jgi:YNFM family putative membrane transporter
MYAVCSVSFAVFSTIFNYLPFRLAGAPFELDTQATTAMYLPYLVGIIVGPLSGRSSDRFGNGWTIGGGALLMIAAVVATLSASWPVVALGLLLLCTGFFAIHAAASGAVNGRVVDGKGRANGLYVLFYYSGGFIGIAIGGYIYESASWGAMIVMLVAMLAVPLAIGWWEQRQIR